MNTALPTTPATLPDTTPGSRSGWEAWPVALIVFFAIFISFLAAFGVFASRQRMDLVRKDYYAEEIRHQVLVNRRENARSLGTTAGITGIPDSDTIRISVPADHSSGIEQGVVEFYRPSDATMDRRLKLEPDSRGSHAISTHGLAPGPWRVRALWTHAGRDYCLEHFFVVSR